MPHSRGRRGPKSGRSKPRQPSRRHGPPSGEPPLVRDVRQALADPDPLRLLTYVSMLMEITDPRRNHPFAGPQERTTMPREELIATFIDTVCPETSALLAVFAEMIGDDDLVRARIRRELATRPTLQPAWLHHLDEIGVNRAALMTHVLGDGDNVNLATRLPAGREATCIVYIDHNMGTLVKDAFVVSEPLDVVQATQREFNQDPDTRWEDLDLADAKARIVAAIDLAAITVPPFETDSWPACRALIEWLIRDLPEGGSNVVVPQWDEDSQAALSDRFFASRFGSRLDDPDHRGLLESILWFATDFSTGDPLRWSPVKIEILLADWIPRKVIAPMEYLALAPDLLRAFIAFTHAEAGIRDELTAESRSAVDHWEPEYLRIIASPRPQGVDAVLAALGLDSGGVFDPDESVADIMLRHLEKEVGGRTALDGLDDRALPDEPFDWGGVAPDITDRVREVLELVDRCCEDLLDTEYRTASRRLLARVAANPEVFQRKGKAHTAAAAVVWIIGKVNDLFRRMQVNDLMDYFGIKGSVSQRAATLLRAAGFSYESYDLSLGSPEYLVSGARRRIIELRDRYRDWETDEAGEPKPFGP